MTNPKSRPSDPIAESLPGYAHEGFTAAEWASRYADLANAAAQAVGVLAMNDPAQRMVKERLEGVLAGQPRPECMTAEQAWADLPASISDGLARPSFVAGYNHAGVACSMATQGERDEAQAELTRLKSDMGKLVGRPGDLETPEAREVDAAFTNVRDRYADSIIKITRLKEEASSWESACSVAMSHNGRLAAEAEKALANAKAAHEVTRNELAWERGWDLHRKDAMGAVVEAARDVVECLRVGGLSDLAALVSLRLSPAITALDQPTQAEPATPPESPAPVEAPSRAPRGG